MKAAIPYLCAICVKNDADRYNLIDGKTRPVCAGCVEIEVGDPEQKQRYAAMRARKKVAQRGYLHDRNRRMRAAGLCQLCGKTNDRLPGGWCCSACAAKRSVQQKAARTA